MRESRRTSASLFESRDQVIAIAIQLWEVFTQEDATLVEINPLAKAPDGTVLALDAKVTLDENAGFRQPEHAGLEDSAAADPLEAAAKEKDLNYVKLDGEVGIIGNGAGLVMSTRTSSPTHGGSSVRQPAKFLDKSAVAPRPRSWQRAATSSCPTRP